MVGRSSIWQRHLQQHTDRYESEWVAMRRYLHRNPELSGAELATTEFLVSAVNRLELPVSVAPEGRGLTADFVSCSTLVRTPRLAIRGDMDALPIHDTKTVEYRSQCDGVMHACGHDVHATAVFAAMQLLVSMHREGQLPWPIAVRAVFQPSEEVATGARYMIDGGALNDVAAIIALHVDPTRSVGCVGLRVGVITAACDLVHVEFHGRGGHGARPHLCHDPIDACTHWVQSAYRAVARRSDPHKTVVISVGQINAGHSANVIPNQAELQGSLRSLDSSSRTVALEALQDVGEAIKRETGCEVVMRLGVSAPAVINDPSLTHILADSAVQMIDSSAVDPIDQPSMGSEDFSYYLEKVPGVMFRLGIVGLQRGSEPLHTSAFDVDEGAIAIGAKIFAAAVINYFDPRRPEEDFPRPLDP